MVFRWRKCGFSRGNHVNWQMKISILHWFCGIYDRPIFYCGRTGQKCRSFLLKEICFFHGENHAELEQEDEDISILPMVCLSTPDDRPAFFQWSYWSKMWSFLMEGTWFRGKTICEWPMMKISILRVWSSTRMTDCILHNGRYWSKMESFLLKKRGFFTGKTT